MSAFGYLGLGILIVGTLLSVLYYIRRSALNEAGREADAERIRAMEAAEAAAREQARKDTDAKIAAVRTADDAAGLLREAFDDPKTN
jgi:hypothetical protein